MLVQLQQMIDNVATQAGPVMRDVAAKAAELAAVAGQKAGPLAYKAAEVTENLGQKVSARSKDFAAEMRRSPTRPSRRATGEPEHKDDDCQAARGRSRRQAGDRFIDLELSDRKQSNQALAFASAWRQETGTRTR